MRRANTVLLTVGSAMLITANVALAAPPISYGQYTAATGTITTGAVSGGTFTANDCPSGFSCGAAITGDGFLQRQLTETASGSVYFQTIILDKGTTASSGGSGYVDLSAKPFADESFVLQGGGTGIADSSHVFATPVAPDTSTFTGDTAINVGWAKTGPENAIDVHQIIDDPNKANLDFRLTDASNDNSQPIVTIDETVYMADGAGNNPNNDRQRLFLKQLKASAGGTTVALPASNPPVATTVTYLANDIVQVMWLGQQVTGGTTGGAQLFGTQSYTVNPTTTATSVSYSDQTATGPWNWDTAFFGAAPTF
jgi:hypothetical protein